MFAVCKVIRASRNDNNNNNDVAVAVVAIVYDDDDVDDQTTLGLFKIYVREIIIITDIH